MNAVDAATRFKTRGSRVRIPVKSLIVVGICSTATVLLWALLRGRSDHALFRELEDVRRARVTFGTDNSRACWIEYVLGDRESIGDALVAPMKAADRIAVPALYEFLGSVQMETPKGQSITMSLFLPWGTFRMGSSYYATDLSRLKEMLTVATSDNSVQIGLALETK